MPKIVGFALILLTAYKFTITMHNVITEFSKHGASADEISIAIATIMGVGALVVAIFNMLWL